MGSNINFWRIFANFGLTFFTALGTLNFVGDIGQKEMQAAVLMGLIFGGIAAFQELNRELGSGGTGGSPAKNQFSPVPKPNFLLLF